MSREVIRAVKFRGYWLAVVQIIVILLASVITLFALNTKAAYSCVLGGLVSVIPNLLFAKKLFQKLYARQAQAFIKTFYRYEIIKLILMGCLFVILLKLKITTELFLVLGFVLAQISSLFLPIIYLMFE